ncbi:MAG: chorismate--pyruvate lyase family protein [Methylophilaceae bacterium]
MKIKHISHRKKWLKKPMFSQQYRHWLIDNGSLTARLQQRYSDFLVKKIRLTNAKPSKEEEGLLKLKPNQHALIRDVLLLGNHQPVVFAHSVLPRSALKGAWNKLGRLGNKPLGATLFANPKVKRSPLEYKKLSRQHPISMQVAGHFDIQPKMLWARRSVFQLKRAKILVTEVFLPQILK